MVEVWSMAFIAIDGVALGPVPWVKFGESPNYVVTHHIASTWVASWRFWSLQRGGGLVALSEWSIWQWSVGMEAAVEDEQLVGVAGIFKKP
ncbi:hypothetical protein F3Y22_tig00111941pilonHSYRG00016 [Hibiscus syriacus]|uniref:Uncharacterized protein n=1 Tax=Hibiscus syriacus TaxID=106335 RepID=A0A6A2XP36_HIBSY|nr:hypothetical protein F3Y22_tig00111941pilonHSYRG00016 [Hibiscus syriacus]